MKKANIILTLLLFFITNTGCASSESSKPVPSSETYYFHPIYCEMPNNISYIFSPSISGNKIYGVYYEIDNSGIYTEFLISMNSDGSDYQEEGYRTASNPDKGIYHNITSLNVTTDGDIWIAENFFEGDNAAVFLKHINGDNVVKEFKIESEYSISHLLVGDDGSFYLGTEASFIVVSSDGLTIIEIDMPVESIIMNPEGDIYLIAKDGYDSKIYNIDIAKDNITEVMTLDDTYSLLLVFDDADADICLYNFDGIYQCDFNNKTITQITSWSAHQIAGYNLYFCFINNNNEIVCGLEGSTSEIVLLQKEEARIDEKIVLTMAIYAEDNSWITEQVNSFNRAQTEYIIEVTNYRNYDTDGDNYGLTLLNTKIITGEIPDIIYTKNLPTEKYINFGLLEDLYPYIENDSELDITQFYDHFISLLDNGGALYEVTPGFALSTVISTTPDIKIGWSFSQLLNIDTDEFSYFPGITRAAFIENIIGVSETEIINYSTGEVNFSSQSFIDLLEFSSTLDEEYNLYAEDADRQTLVTIVNMTDFYDIQIYDQMYGDDYSFVGFSSTDQVAVLIPHLQISMSSTSDHKDAVWSFLREFLTIEYQMNQIEDRQIFYPLDTKALEYSIELAMTPTYTIDENGNEVEDTKGGVGFQDGRVYMFYSASQDNIDKVMDLINETHSLYKTDNTVLDIVYEEASSFYKNLKSAEEVAAIIESRISIYIDEQQ